MWELDHGEKCRCLQRITDVIMVSIFKKYTKILHESILFCGSGLFTERGVLHAVVGSTLCRSFLQSDESVVARHVQAATWRVWEHLVWYCWYLQSMQSKDRANLTSAFKVGVLSEALPLSLCLCHRFFQNKFSINATRMMCKETYT